MNRAVIHIDYRKEWEIPQDLFDQWNEEFQFTLDAASLPHNAKCRKFYTPKDDGLAQPWAPHTVWCNPPYGRGVAKWLEKGIEEAKQGATVVFFLPANTDPGWFHDLVLPHAEIRFLRGRVKMIPPQGKIHRQDRPSNGSMLAIYRPSE